MFSTVWQPKENTEERKPGRKFSPGPTIFFLLNWEENCGGEKWTCGIFTQMPSLTYPLHKHNGCSKKNILKKNRVRDGERPKRMRALLE